MKRCGIELRKPGPRSALPKPIESDLHDWAGAMQIKGHPPTRRVLLLRANRILKRLKKEGLTALDATFS